VLPELEFIPEFAVAAVDPDADALAPLWSGEDAVPDVALALFPAPLADPVT
jgi:hypothetical protein